MKKTTKTNLQGVQLLTSLKDKDHIKGPALPMMAMDAINEGMNSSFAFTHAFRVDWTSEAMLQRRDGPGGSQTHYSHYIFAERTANDVYATLWVNEPDNLAPVVLAMKSELGQPDGLRIHGSYKPEEYLSVPTMEDLHAAMAEVFKQMETAY